MSEIHGTPIICRDCGHQTTVRLTKGTRIRSLTCLKCLSEGTFTRNTEYDKKRRK